jgi:hypothetical protein
MGIATEHTPAPAGGMKPYGLWEIDVRPFNASQIEIDKFIPAVRISGWAKGSSLFD